MKSSLIFLMLIATIFCKAQVNFTLDEKQYTIKGDLTDSTTDELGKMCCYLEITADSVVYEWTNLSLDGSFKGTITKYVRISMAKADIKSVAPVSGGIIIYSNETDQVIKKSYSPFSSSYDLYQDFKLIIKCKSEAKSREIQETIKPGKKKKKK